MSDTTKTVDFLPTLTIAGDLKKISEYDIATYNTIISAVFTVLSMEKGTNQLFPDMGAKDDMMRIFNSEEAAIQGILDTVTTNLRCYTGNEVVIDYAKDSKDPEMINIKITVVGLPGSTIVGLTKSGKFIKTKNPSYFM